MKKLLVTACIVATSFSASVFSKSISLNKLDSSFIEWGLTYQDNYVDVVNNLGVATLLTINVKNEFLRDNKSLHSDRVTMLCDNKPSFVNAGSSGVCKLSSGKHIRLMIAATDYQNGAEGTGRMDS